MEFKDFNALLQEHVDRMVQDETRLYTVNLNAIGYNPLWNLYLDSFPPGTNEVFRERREYDCSCCCNFIRDFGAVIKIKDQKVTTIWDFETGSDKYQPVIDALAARVRGELVSSIFVTETRRIGTASNIEICADGQTHTWNHLHVRLPPNISVTPRYKHGRLRGDSRDQMRMFKRALSEIEPHAVDAVLELIDQNTLYRGEQWHAPLENLKKLQAEHHNLNSSEKRMLFYWEVTTPANSQITNIRNTSIGTLLVNLSTGMDLDTAVRKYEAITAPSNYRRPKAVFTKSMVASAEAKVKELGFENSLARRFATIQDITVNNTLFANRDAKRAMASGVFEELAQSVPSKPLDLSRVEEIGIDKFITDVLPTVSALDVYLENKHSQNLCSLIAPLDSQAKSMFSWGNNFSWAYNGNVADSMKERVKAAGGKVDGELRFSIQWNEHGDNLDDLDAHCIEPQGFEIMYSSKVNQWTNGNLDIDIIEPNGVAVENITWPQRSTMQKGKYQFFVNNYTSRNARSGFSAEIEFDGEVYSFEYPKPLTDKENIAVADVHFDGEKFKITPRLKANSSSKELWSLKSNETHPVSIALLSPNYWDGRGVGLKHYFFMVEGCVNPDLPNGFFNEFLNSELRPHRKVFEALGSKMKVDRSALQLSGLGFSSSKRAELVVRVQGAIKRMLKIKF